MSNLIQRSDIAYKLNNGQPIDLTCTVTGVSGAAKAKLFQRRIIVDLVAALNTETVTINTPIAFEILDVYVIQEASSTTAIQVKSDSGDITNDITVTTINTLYYAASINDDNGIFARGDDDLILAIGGSNAATAKVIITIEPVVKP